MSCRLCQGPIQPDLAVAESLGPTRTARQFEDCIWHCDPCGVGYSNAKTESNRRLIYRSAQDNLPAEVRDGLGIVLASAVNLTARTSKESRMAFVSSEDAVTWTVIRGLQQQGSLSAVVPDGEEPRGTPSLLLWGAPAGGSGDHRLAEELIGASDDLKEDPRRRSEPDVVLWWGDLLAVVEAKYRSPNDRQRADYPNWSRYLDREDLFTASSEAVRGLGRYELVRNWRLAVRLRERLRARRVVLVNLGRPSIRKSAEGFAEQLACDQTRGFAYRSWTNVLDAARPVAAWLELYARERTLLGGEEAAPSPGRLGAEPA